MPVHMATRMKVPYSSFWLHDDLDAFYESAEHDDAPPVKMDRKEAAELKRKWMDEKGGR